MGTVRNGTTRFPAAQTNTVQGAIAGPPFRFEIFGGRRAGASRGLRVRVARSLEVGELVVAADIVHLAVHALVHDRVKRVSDVRHKDEVSRV